MSPVLPDPDLLPLPAPVWLLQLLLLVTFGLHLIAMNLLLGGGILASISGVRGRTDRANHGLLASRIYPLLPVLSAATITLGVAPLLFVQVLYGRFFYTSSILLAIPWLAVVALLILAYSGHYLLALSDPGRRERLLWVGAGAGLLVLGIAFIYTNNFSLMLTPGRFREIYLANRSGLRLNLQEPSLIPRALHFLVAALAVTGLGTAGLGHLARARGEESFGSWAVRYGTIWFAAGTLVQLLVGFWFLVALPRPIQDAFLGGDPVRSIHLGVAVLLALVAVILLIVKNRSRGVFLASAGLLLLSVSVMVIIRHWVREMMIGELDGLADAPVRTQGSVLAVFLVLFAVSVATLGWMIRRWRQEGAR